MFFSFANIKKILFLGDITIISSIIEKYQIINIDLVVFTAERFYDKKAIKIINNLEIKYFLSEDINNDSILEKEIISGKTLAISISEPWGINKNTIKLFDNKVVNLHASKLPQNRGGGQISWNIIQGNRNSAIVFHLMNGKADEGDIIDYKEVIYPSYCKIPRDFYRYQNIVIIKFCLEFLEKIAIGYKFKPLGQVDYLSSFFPRLNTDIHGFINWEWSLSEIENFINAFSDPFDGAITFLNGQKVRIKSVHSEKGDGVFHPFQVGIVFRKNENGVFIATKNGTLFVETILDNDSNNINDKVRLGDRFFTPKTLLDKAISTKIEYNHEGVKYE